MQTWSSYTQAQCVWWAAGAQNTLLFLLSYFVHHAHCLDTNFSPSHSGCECTALPTFLQEAERIRRNLPQQPWVCAAGWSKLLNQAVHEGWTGRLVTALRTSTKTDAWDKILQKCRCDSSKSLGRLCVSCEQQPARRWPSWGQQASPHGAVEQHVSPGAPRSSMKRAGWAGGWDTHLAQWTTDNFKRVGGAQQLQELVDAIKQLIL